MFSTLVNDVFYYTSDGKKFYNKSLAYAHAKASNSKVYFYFFDGEYDKFDWTVEPTESLDSLYLQRAKELRDSFKHIVICYSGGYDSTNIIQTFVKNNILIDEVVIVGSFSQDTMYGADENHNGEVYHNVFPELKKIDARTKVNVIDYTKCLTSLELVKANNIDILSNLNTHHSIHNWFWVEISKHICCPKDSTAIIFGCDKPSVRFQDGKFVNVFVDVSVATYGYFGRVFGDMQYGTKNINFYSHPTAAKITIKQCHVIKRLYETIFNTIIDKRLHQQINEMNVEFYQNYIAKIIYPNVQLPFRSPKSKNLILSLRDAYILKHNNSPIKDLFKRYMIERATKKDFDLIMSKSYALS